MKKNTALFKIGDIVKYNGCSPVHYPYDSMMWVGLYDQLIVNHKYIVRDILMKDNVNYYLIKFKNNSTWFPEMVFDMTKNSICEKYNLR